MTHLGEKKGIINSEGKVCLYDGLCEFDRNGLSFFDVEGKVGIIDIEGNTIIEPIWDNVLDFGKSGYNDGVRRVVKDDKFGIIDAEGNIIVELLKETIGSFKENGTAIIVNDWKYGFINKNGEVFIEPQYDWVTPFGRKTEKPE